MASIKPTKTVFTASQFLEWQRSKSLQLSPIFQRRAVWKAPARSQLIDSIYRGYPIPIIMLRQVQDLKTLKSTMEVVDGQQRLRTLICYLDPQALPGYDEARDAVVVRRSHNPDLAGKPFAKLPADVKQAILDYEFSTHILPASAGDELVFRIFARLNSTGLSLNKQEIRNAEYHGAFKSLAYDLAFQYLDDWRKWGVYNNTDIARMEEAEAASEFLIVMMEGLRGKTQGKIDKYYRENDDALTAEHALRDRFNKVMAGLATHLGTFIADTPFTRPALFFSLWVALYSHMYGLGSSLKRRPPASLPAVLSERFRRVSDLISSGTLSEKVQDAMDKATSDPGRRKVRHDFLVKRLALKSA